MLVALRQIRIRTKGELDLGQLLGGSELEISPLISRLLLSRITEPRALDFRFAICSSKHGRHVRQPIPATPFCTPAFRFTCAEFCSLLYCLSLSHCELLRSQNTLLSVATPDRRSGQTLDVLLITRSGGLSVKVYAESDDMPIEMLFVRMATPNRQMISQSFVLSDTYVVS